MTNNTNNTERQLALYEMAKRGGAKLMTKKNLYKEVGIPEGTGKDKFKKIKGVPAEELMSKYSITHADIQEFAESHLKENKTADMKSYQKSYREEHKEDIKAYNESYREEHKEDIKAKAQRRKEDKELIEKIREQLEELLVALCVYGHSRQRLNLKRAIEYAKKKEPPMIVEMDGFNVSEWYETAENSGIINPKIVIQPQSALRRYLGVRDSEFKLAMDQIKKSGDFQIIYRTDYNINGLIPMVEVLEAYTDTNEKRGRLNDIVDKFYNSLESASENDEKIESGYYDNPYFKERRELIKEKNKTMPDEFKIHFLEEGTRRRGNEKVMKYKREWRKFYNTTNPENIKNRALSYEEDIEKGLYERFDMLDKYFKQTRWSEDRKEYNSEDINGSVLRCIGGLARRLAGKPPLDIEDDIYYHLYKKAIEHESKEIIDYMKFRFTVRDSIKLMTQIIIMSERSNDAWRDWLSAAHLPYIGDYELWVETLRKDDKKTMEEAFGMPIRKVYNEYKRQILLFFEVEDGKVLFPKKDFFLVEEGIFSQMVSEFKLRYRDVNVMNCHDEFYFSRDFYIGEDGLYHFCGDDIDEVLNEAIDYVYLKTRNRGFNIEGMVCEYNKETLKVNIESK